MTHRSDKSDNPMVYFPIKLYEGSFEQETPTFTFLARTSKGNSIIAINKSEFDEEELEEIISKLKEYKKDSDLKFIEIRRKIGRAQLIFLLLRYIMQGLAYTTSITILYGALNTAGKYFHLKSVADCMSWFSL